MDSREKFDGIVWTPEAIGDDLPPSSSGFSSVYHRLRQRNKTVLYAVGAGAVVLLIVVVAASSGSSSKASGLTGAASLVDAKNQHTNIKDGLLTVTPRQRPPGSYQDVQTMSMHEDMSAFAGLGLGVSTIDMNVEFDVDSTIGVPNPKTGLQNYHTKVTRVVGKMNMGAGHVVDCDTADPNPKYGGICSEFSDLLGMEDDYTVNTEKGTATLNTEKVNGVTQKMRLSGDNPIADTAHILGLLPGEPVEIGEAWVTDLELGEMGSFHGNSKFEGIVPCGGNPEDGGMHSTTCAKITTSGELDLDIEKLVASMGSVSSMASALDGMTVTAPTLEMEIHWDDVNGYTRYNSQLLGFTLNLPNPLNADEIYSVPVKEEMTGTANRIG